MPSEAEWNRSLLWPSTGPTLQQVLQVDPEVVIWNQAWPIAEGGRNTFKAAICLKQQIISSLSHYESVITRAVNCHQSIGHTDRRLFLWRLKISTWSHGNHTHRHTHTSISSLINSQLCNIKKNIQFTKLERQDIFCMWSSGGLTPTYGLASSRHPHSFRKKEKKEKKLDWGQSWCLKYKMFT